MMLFASDSTNIFVVVIVVVVFDDIIAVVHESVFGARVGTARYSRMLLLLHLQLLMQTMRSSRMIMMMKRVLLRGLWWRDSVAHHHHGFPFCFFSRHDAAFVSSQTASSSSSDGRDGAVILSAASAAIAAVFILLILQILKIASSVLQSDGESSPDGYPMSRQRRANLKDFLEEHRLLMLGDVLQSRRRLPDVGVHRRFADERVEIQLRFGGFLALSLLLQHVVDVVGAFRMTPRHVGQGRQRGGVIAVRSIGIRVVGTAATSVAALLLLIMMVLLLLLVLLREAGSHGNRGAGCRVRECRRRRWRREMLTAIKTAMKRRRWR